MSRGGRRRRTKRSTQGTTPIAGGSRADELVEPQDKESLTGRARREPAGREGNAVEQMRTLPATVSTLPPDGLVLEDLIATMQSEYGTPSTPQEYRLLLKVSATEEAVVAPAPEPSEDAPADDDSPARRPRSARRRRRGGRRLGSTEETAPEEGKPAEDSPEPDVR